MVFDYSDPPDRLSPEMRALHDRRAAYVEAEGEPWVSYFDSDEMTARLMALGYSEVEDLSPAQIAATCFPNRIGDIPRKGGHVLRATTIRTE